MWVRMAFIILLCPLLGFAEPLDKVVAVVNDNVITQTELDKEVDMLHHQLDAKNASAPPEEILRKQVLQHLIEVDLQLQLAKIHDLQIDNTELDATIAKIAQDNKLSLTQLREELSKQGFSWDAYRENLRKEMLMARLQQQAVGKDIVVSTEQVEDYLKTSKYNAKMQYSYHVMTLVVPLPNEPTTAQLKQAETKAQAVIVKLKAGEDLQHVATQESNAQYALDVRDLGEQHPAELPEAFASRVIDMHVGDVAGPIVTGNGIHVIRLMAINENNAQHYVTKTHVRHILLKQAANMTTADAERQVQNLYQQLKSGLNFAVMAKKYSLDAASAVKGGDLGWVLAEELVPEFAEAMNTLPLNTVSQPIKTKFGWHLIEVLARETVDDSDAFQRQQVRQSLTQRKFKEAVQNWKQHIRADAYVHIADKSLA